MYASARLRPCSAIQSTIASHDVAHGTPASSSKPSHACEYENVTTLKPYATSASRQRAPALAPTRGQPPAATKPVATWLPPARGHAKLMLHRSRRYACAPRARSGPEVPVTTTVAPSAPSASSKQSSELEPGGRVDASHAATSRSSNGSDAGATPSVRPSSSSTASADPRPANE